MCVQEFPSFARGPSWQEEATGRVVSCGTPVAAYPVPGPIDLLHDPVGAMDPELGWAIARALQCGRSACVAYARGFSWTESARQFLAALAPAEKRAAA